MSPLYSDESISTLQRKIPLLFSLVLFFVLIVLIRLFYLQVYRGEDYRHLSRQISVREEEVRARRGLIVDRKGKILADSRPYHEIAAIPQYLGEREKTIASLSSLIPVSADWIRQKLEEGRAHPPFFPVVLAGNAPYDWIAHIKEYGRPEYEPDTPVSLQGIEVRESSLRVYLYPELFSHALGYLTEIDKKSLENLSLSDPGRYSMGDLVGASGMEKTYDRELRGIDGVTARVVDARGHEIRENPDLEMLEEKASFAPEDGLTLVTTLDFEAQEAAAKALGDRRGAVVGLDPNTGEVLVLYSSPGFDANKILKNVDKDYWQKINLHEDKYLYNRAVQAAYPPGSTYKVVGAFGGLDSGVLTLEKRFGCGGGIQFGNRFFRCWRSGGHGLMNVVSGLTQSCDTFFYTVGLKLGVDRLAHYADLLGLGKKTGIDIPFEQGGLIPSSAWKEKRFKQPWIESETLSIAIGQGYDLLTPLQNAVVIAMIANGGKPLTPHLGKEIMGRNGQIAKKMASLLGEPVIKPEVLKLIQEGLIGVVHGPGTATRLRASPHKIAGKTGTAQVIGEESRVARTERTRDHAWFIAYAPYDNPQIAVSVLVENGGHGGGAAAPIAQAVIDSYLSKENNLP